MLIEDVEYSDERSLSKNFEGKIFRHCVFEKISVEGGCIDAIFLNCEVSATNWYWGIFTHCLFVDTNFTDCAFHGTSFSKCRF